MYNKTPFVKERNPLAQQNHRKQVFWQITVPLIAVVVVILAVAVLAATGSVQSTSLWANISLIWLLIPVMVFALILMVILAGLVYAVIWLVRILPGYSLQVQNFMVAITSQVEKLGNAIVEPILRVNAFLASLQALRRSLRRN
jgi:hypothetical protein